MAIPRRNPEISEAIEILERHYDRRRTDAYARIEAFDKLGREERSFVDEEIRKCVQSHRYYMQNYHVINTEYEGLTTFVSFWDSQVIFLEKVESIQAESRPVKIVTLKARQLGLSTVSEALCFHKTIFTDSCNMLIVAQDPSQTDYLFSMSRRAYDQLPWWMQPERRYEAKGKYMVFDRDNPDMRQTDPGLNSTIYVEAANKISGVARGKTIRSCHLSEISSWPAPEVLVEQVYPSMNAPDTIAIMESTAKGRNNFFHRFWRDALNEEIDWDTVFIEFFRVRKYFLPIPAGTNFVMTEEESAIQTKVLRETGINIEPERFNWRRSKMKEFITVQGEEWKFYQEYPSATWQEAFQGSGLCAFNKRKLHTFLETTCERPKFFGEIEYKANRPRKCNPLLTEVKKDETGQFPFIPPAEQFGGRLRVWELPDEGESYYIGVDVSMGIEGGDFSCAQIIKIGHGLEPDEQVAEWRGWINPEQLAPVCVALAEWYNHAQLAVECNDVGKHTNNLIFRVYEYDNIFRWKQYDKIKNYITDFLGWYTNSKTRDVIITKTKIKVEEKSLIIRSADLIEEMIDFAQEEGSSRYEGQNSNDDRVFGMMIAAWCAHDSDWGQAVAATPRTEAEKKHVAWVIFDQFNRIITRVTNQEVKDTMLQENPGWYAKQTISVRDFSNTDYSPVYDKPGPRASMHEMGYPATAIALDSIVEKDKPEVPGDDWRNL